MGGPEDGGPMVVQWVLVLIRMVVLWVSNGSNGWSNGSNGWSNGSNGWSNGFGS